MIAFGATVTKPPTDVVAPVDNTPTSKEVHVRVKPLKVEHPVRTPLRLRTDS